MDSQDILTIVEDITKSKNKNKEEYFSSKYPTFKEKYPMLFEKVCNSKNFDMKMLKFLLNINDKNDKDDGSVIVGQHLYDKYVAPVIPKEENK